MLLRNTNGTYKAGPFDIILIVLNDTTNRFHVTLYEERFDSCLIADDEIEMRMKIKFHHVDGVKTIPEALVEIARMRAMVDIDDHNVITTPVHMTNIIIQANGGKPEVVNYLN